MNTIWPVTGLLLATSASAITLLVVLLAHLSPHPRDIAIVRAELASKSLEPRSIRRSFAVWRHHYRRGAWQLSRLSRFYVVELTKNQDKLLVAVDPWQPRRGAQIV